MLSLLWANVLAQAVDGHEANGSYLYQPAYCLDKLLRGPAEILESGPEHDRAQALIVARYPQLRPMRIAELPVIALRIARATDWGKLSAG